MANIWDAAQNILNEILRFIFMQNWLFTMVDSLRGVLKLLLDSLLLNS